VIAAKITHDTIVQTMNITTKLKTVARSVTTNDTPRMPKPSTELAPNSRIRAAPTDVPIAKVSFPKNLTRIFVSFKKSNAENGNEDGSVSAVGCSSMWGYSYIENLLCD
jgi:hypothetical protein